MDVARRHCTGADVMGVFCQADVLPKRVKTYVSIKAMGLEPGSLSSRHIQEMRVALNLPCWRRRWLFLFYLQQLNGEDEAGEWRNLGLLTVAVCQALWHIELPFAANGHHA